MKQLQLFLPETAQVLEIASGTGQHARTFTDARPDWQWWPTDIDEENLSSIRAWRTAAGQGFHAPAYLNVENSWPSRSFDAVFCANMLHIAPIEAMHALMKGAASVLRATGSLITYGPYKVDGSFSGPNDEAFDASLRSRNERWGIRDLEKVDRAAKTAGLQRRLKIAMPANNLLLAFSR